MGREPQEHSRHLFSIGRRDMEKEVELQPVRREDRAVFLEMACRYFGELNPDFVPQDDWKAHYFDSIQSNENVFPCWIMVGRECCGFIIFGTQKQHFLPRSNGTVYELYVLPEHRRKGIGKACAIEALAELSAQGVSRIQLEVMEGNQKAAALWEQLGFRKFSERFILEREN